MLNVNHVNKSYQRGGLFSKERKQVLTDVSFEVKGGECLGIIGESGSGKSTLGRLLIGIEKPDRGTVTFNGVNVSERNRRIGKISAVFQDYKSSINPFFTVEQAILEPLELQKISVDQKAIKVDGLLSEVGLPRTYKHKYPHELSGGEIQRVCIARAISTEPDCILFDEAISSLDVSVQLQVLNLLRELKETHSMTYVFITHDIQAAAYICDSILIFRNGQVEEMVETERLKDVQSDYAKQLLRALITF
ncbi:ABC transporter ATP-binding protein [Rossellomorea yichunensis]|uniref:ABC transporter ATP-binding protein n=1 Tax=Rossellomorea yichunensis TaxID=3077331 RepID=UPI0028DE4D04|nr:ABC transporter ATP-binding protein [Rossellomorea sp. YC4-1]MDT9027284.1 ABC transporter ATP-binding protein [Rossellomorea sp. YC4-1]